MPPALAVTQTFATDGRVGGDRTRTRLGRIVVRGEFGPLLGVALPECEIAVLSGETHVTSVLRDEAELYGLLGRLRDFGATLVSVSVDPS
jgi:hypothetical protein